MTQILVDHKPDSCDKCPFYKHKSTNYIRTGLEDGYYDYIHECVLGKSYSNCPLTEIKG